MLKIFRMRAVPMVTPPCTGEAPPVRPVPAPLGTRGTPSSASSCITRTVSLVSKGSTIANQTAEALAAIVEGVTQASDLATEIAAASNEQAQGIQQVDQGISQIDSVTQQNSASAEETASAAQELTSETRTLQELTGHFILAETSRAGSPTEPSQPALPFTL